MPTMPFWFVPALFGWLAVLFAGLALRDRLRHGPEGGGDRRAWTRLAIIFAIVSVALIYFQRDRF